jgi:hypothetical protein
VDHRLAHVRRVPRLVVLVGHRAGARCCPGPRWGGARIAVPAVVVFTTVTLGVTIQHADKLHLDGGLALGTRVVAWVWIVVCATVAVLLAVGLVGQWRRSTTVAPPGRLPLSARAVLSVIAAFFVGIGLVLLMAPGRIDLACPLAFHIRDERVDRCLAPRPRHGRSSRSATE